ncbi:hypothetical protein OQA88_7863 [Cercophora sp. LCS_1]
MHKTRTLGSLKSIFPPIHPPLPLSGRESQKLLNVLTSSFRAQLDEEHGTLNKKDLVDLPTRPAVKYLPSTPERTPSRPTDRHLGAILNNPLFNDAALKSESSSGADPKEVFMRAVAKGLMTISRAHGFLLRVLQDIRKSSAISFEDGMREYGAGLLVVRWLRASGQEREFRFIKKQNFTTDLLRFMVAEGLDELVWTWFRRLQDASFSDPTTARILLRSFISVKCESSELDGAYSAVLEVEKQLRLTSDPAAKKLLLSTWSIVAHKTISDSWRNKIHNVALFESFCALGTSLNYPVANARAHLDLYHPDKPSAEAALRQLYKPKLWHYAIPSQIDKWVQSGAGPELPHLIKQINNLGLDTVQHLIKHGQTSTAEALLEHIRVQLEAQERYLPIGLSVLSKQGLKDVDQQHSFVGVPSSTV